METKEISEGVLTKKEARNSSGLSHRGGGPNQVSSPCRVPGPVYHKTGHTGAYGLHFRRSTYGWKANLIRKPTQVVSHQKLFGINGNRRSKSASRIYQSAAIPSFGPLDRVSSLGPLGDASRGGDFQDSIIISRRSP